MLILSFLSSYFLASLQILFSFFFSVSGFSLVKLLLCNFCVLSISLRLLILILLIFSKIIFSLIILIFLWSSFLSFLIFWFKICFLSFKYLFLKLNFLFNNKLCFFSSKINLFKPLFLIYLTIPFLLSNDFVFFFFNIKFSFVLLKSLIIFDIFIFSLFCRYLNLLCLIFFIFILLYELISFFEFLLYNKIFEFDLFLLLGLLKDKNSLLLYCIFENAWNPFFLVGILLWDIFLLFIDFDLVLCLIFRSIFILKIFSLSILFWYFWIFI